MIVKISSAYLKILATRISQYPQEELAEFLLGTELKRLLNTIEEVVPEDD